MILSANSLTKRLGTTLALNRLSFKLNEGIVGLVGRNGAGKSTLLRTIAGIYRPDEGNIACDDIDVGLGKAPEGTFFLPDDPYCPNGLNLKGFFDFLSCHYEMDLERLFDLASEFDLPTDKPISGFSKGMKRQAYLCAALSVNSRILLLDEAFDGLDPLALEKVRSRIVEDYAGKEKLVLIASHNIVSLERLADSFLLIDNGSLKESGSTEEMAKGLRKVQAVFPLPVGEDELRKLGIDVRHFRSQGVMCEFLTHSEDALKVIRENFAPPYSEIVPLSATEIIAFAMEENGK